MYSFKMLKDKAEISRRLSTIAVMEPLGSDLME